MEEYINEAGDLYTIDEINQAAEENKTTFEDIIKKNKLSPNKKKETVTEEVTTEVPGKPKPVVKKDAVAAVKSTASKSAKPSSVSPVNPFGKTKVFDPLGLEKFKRTPAPKPVKIIDKKQDIRPISEYQDRLKKEEEGSFSNYLKESFDAGFTTIVESLYRVPEYAFDVAATITNPIGRAIEDVTGVDVGEDTSSEKIMKAWGIRNVPADILAKRVKESNKIIEDYNAKTGGDPLTAIEKGNYLGAAKMVAGGTTQSVPMMAAAILSGGSTQALAGIATSTAVSRAQQLKIEQPEMDVQTRTTNAAVSGLLEGYLGNMFTGASGAVIKRIITDKGVKAGSKIVSNGLMSSLEKAIEKNPMIGVLGEVAEESSVELGNQLNDINSGIRKELDTRSIINAGIVATGMAGTNTVPIYAAKGYMKAKDYNQVKTVNKEINNLSAQLSNPYISDSDKQIISSRVARLVDENKAVVGANLEKIDALPNNIKSEIVTINTDLDDLKSKYLDIIDNPELPADVQRAMTKELELQAKGLQNRKSSIIEGNYVYEDFRRLPQPEQDRIKVLANETLVADAELNNDPKTSFNDDEINREAINVYNAELRARDLVADVEKTKAAAKAIGLSEEIDMPELNTANDVINYLSENTELDENTIEDIADSYGAFIPLANGKEALIINKEAAAMDQVVTTGQHEFLHKLVYKAVKDNPELQKKIGTDLYNHIENYIGTEEFNNTEFKNRYDTYKTDFENTKLELENKIAKAKSYFENGTITQDRYNQAVSDAESSIFKAEGKYLEETLPLLSESLTKGDVKYNETFFTKIGDILRRIFQKYGLSKVKFNTGKDVFDFVRDYNKSFEKGQFTKAFKALAKEGTYKGSVAKGNAPVRAAIKTEVKKSQGLSQVETLKNQLKEIQDNEFDYDPDDFDQQVANLQSKIKKAVEKEKTTPVVEAKKEVSEEDTVKEIIKSERGSVSSDRVQQIYNDKGINGAAEIIKIFRPITNKIVDKRRDAPGFDRELLTDEIETGVGGILDLIKKYNPESGIPLAAYINKYLPVRAIATSRRILDQQFKKDVTEEKGLMAEETVVETKEKPKYKNVLESKVFEPETLQAINDKILTVVRTLKSKIDEPISLNRTVTPIIAEIRDEMGKLVDIDIKTAMGGKKDNQLKNWLLNNKRYILENMTTTWLMGKDGQGGMPIAIQKQIDGRWTNYPEWVGQKIDREKTSTDNAGRTSGAELVRRLPNVANNISDSQFLDQVIGPDGNPLRGRKESLAKAIAEESAFDIINNDFENEGPIFEAFKANQERLGVELLNNAVVEFGKQVDRGNIKFSKTLLERIKESSDDIANHVSINGTPNLNNVKQALITTFPDWEKSEIDVAATLLTPNIVSAFKQIKGLKKVKPVDLLSSSIKNVANDLDTGTIITKKLGSEVAVAKFFRTPEYLTDIKALDFGFSEAVLKKYGREKGLDLLNSLWRPTVAGKTTKGAISIYEGSKGYSQHLENLQKITGNGKIEEVGQTYKKINRVFDNNLNGKFDKEKDVRKSNEAWDLAVFAADWYSKEIANNSNNYGPEHLAAFYTLLIKENDSVLRSAAPVTGIIVDNNIKYLKKYDYDHSKPVSYVVRRLIDKFVYNKDVDLQLLKQDYEVNIIPKTISDKLNKLGLKSMMPVDYREGIGSYIRIGKATNEVINKYEKFSDIVKKENIITLDAVTKSLNPKFSKTPKGISVFDFDDTVGLTKSNVLYTMPGDQMIYHGAPRGKNVTKISDKGVRFFATDVKEANEYARMNSGVTQEFVINNSQVADESVAISKMKELGLTPKNKEFEIDDAQFYELIDTRFEESLSKPDIIKLFDALKKANVKAIRYDDGAQVSGKSTISIAVIDPSVISNPKKLNAEEFAKDGASLLEAGAKFDFSEFSKVTNGKPGPMVEKMKKMISKFGPDNFFILTARPADSAGPIHEFLKSIGINIPLKNITGLGNSTAQAKADWITEKAAEGYNDFYFADDAIQNVNAVKNALNVLDVKSKIQQAKIKFSKTISPEFNKIIQENTGMEDYKVFSDIVARRRGADKNKFDFYVPPSAADFELLLYNFIGKGKRGEEQQKFFSDALLKPYANGNDLMDAARQSIKNDYKALTDQFPDIKNKIEKLTPDGDFTYDQAIRVAMWTEEGVEIPGISQRDQKKLTELVNNDPELAAFKQGLIVTGRQGKGWVTPTEFWDASTIISDLHNLTEGEGRKKFLAEFIDNAQEMFGKWENGKLVGPNINKVEAVYGTNVREAIEDVLWRMTTGKNRSQGKDKETSMWANWVTGSTGAIMFLNVRSAALQLIGAVNFLNLRDNNPIAAAAAFANQKQYWADFARIWNSDKMKERRGGLKEDVAAAEIANAAAGSKNKVGAVLSYLLKIGYTPTQMADSFAIASGGAPFYRNRIKSYLKEGMTEEQAETAAWNDFTKVSDETQQSGDPRDISKQQASGAGRLLLTFQNTAMQQSRIVKKAILDLKNRRGNDKTNVAKIAYYLAIQNTMFAVLQQGLFAVAFGYDDEDKEKPEKEKKLNEKLVDVADGVVDTILRGTGFTGGVIATLKNMAKKYLEEKDKKFKADYAKVMLEGANISPPIGSKLRKLYSGLQQTKFESDLIKERGWGVMQDGRVHLGPMYGVSGKLVESFTNVPMDRLVTKIENASQAMNTQNEAWQRVMVGLGWSPYSIGIEESAGDQAIRAKAKEIRKEEGKIKAKETRERTKDSINALPIEERLKLKRETALKRKAERIKKRNRKMG